MPLCFDSLSVDEFCSLSTDDYALMELCGIIADSLTIAAWCWYLAGAANSILIAHRSD